MMNKAIQPTPLTDADVPEINEIGYSYWREEGVYSKGVLERIFKDGLSYGIRIDNELVAFSVLQKAKKEVIVFFLAVKNTHLRQGLGKKILTFTIDNAVKSGHTNFILHVAVDNQPAMKLYKSVGFVNQVYLSNYYSPNKYNLERNAYQMSYKHTQKNSMCAFT